MASKSSIYPTSAMEVVRESDQRYTLAAYHESPQDYLGPRNTRLATVSVDRTDRFGARGQAWRFPAD